MRNDDDEDPAAKCNDGHCQDAKKFNEWREDADNGPSLESEKVKRIHSNEFHKLVQ